MRDLQQVTNLSIRGRDPISLLKILPGVQLLANDQETFGGSFATPVPGIQGGRGQTVYVDGINGADGGGGNFSGRDQPRRDCRGQRADEHRGTAYTYQRFTELNATNFFINRDNIPKPD